MDLSSEDAKLIRSFDVDGCRRRRGQPGRGTPKFRCDGNIGPPCTIKRGDTVYLDVEFAPGKWGYYYDAQNGMEFLEIPIFLHFLLLKNLREINFGIHGQFHVKF